jgi:uncharacterized protein
MCSAPGPDPDHHNHESPGHESPDGYTKTSRNWQGEFAKTPGRFLGMGLIRAYQLTLSSLIGQNCRHMPTCSEYGYEAVARHGLWTGSFMALFRFMRCGPGGTWGYDPVPAKLEARQHWYTPWRLWTLSRGQSSSSSNGS